MFLVSCTTVSNRVDRYESNYRYEYGAAEQDRKHPGAVHCDDEFVAMDLAMRDFRFNSIYFSFATLSTIGYGDISPVAGVARMLAVAEAVVGMFYVTMLIARLVSLYSAGDSTSS